MEFVKKTCYRFTVKHANVFTLFPAYLPLLRFNSGSFPDVCCLLEGIEPSKPAATTPFVTSHSTCVVVKSDQYTPLPPVLSHRYFC